MKIPTQLIVLVVFLVCLCFVMKQGQTQLMKFTNAFSAPISVEK